MDFPRPVIHCLALTAVLVLCVRTFWFDNYYLSDFYAFYYAGREVLAGRDPYLGLGGPPRLMTLNPPSVLPICVGIAVLPFRWGGMAWVLLNVAGMLALVEGARRVLNAQGGLGGREIPAETTAGLMAALVLSTGLREGLLFGQLHILTTWALIGAMLARASGQPVLAGLSLALATIKPHTLLPFLILFRRKSDWPTWAALAAATLALVISTTPPAEIPQRLQSWRTCVGRNFGEGSINDYSHESLNSYSLISLSHALYGLGLRDREMILATQITLLGLLGVGLAFEILWRRRISESASCALLACYAAILMYHRAYDGAVLALPLVYAVAGARSSRRISRALFIASAFALLLAVNPYGTIQAKLLAKSRDLGVVGWLIHAFLIPYPTWAALLALLGLWLSVRWEPSAVASPVRKGAVAAFPS